MAKRKTMEEVAEDERPTAEVFSPFVGAEEDDLSTMTYVQDEKSTTKVNTMPPETEAEKEAEDEFIDPTPPEGDEAKAEDEGEEEEPAQAAAEEGEESEVLEDEPVSDELSDEPQIPKHRFDEINDRNKKLEAELEALKDQVSKLVEGGPPPAHKEEEPEPYDYAAKEKEVMDAVLEGDADKYTRLRNEIRAQEKADYLREAKRLAAEGDETVRETVSFEETGTQIEQQYPQFSTESEVYNPEARQDLLDLYVGYVAKGMPRSDALRQAAERTAKLYRLGETVVEDLPADPKKVTSIKPVDPKEKAGIARQQPPKPNGKSGAEDMPRFNFATMSDEEFDKLPESTKRRARGDVL